MNGELRYKHYTVNNSKNFVDPLTKRHTQLIERLWGAKKRIMHDGKGTNAVKLPYHLAEV